MRVFRFTQGCRGETIPWLLVLPLIFFVFLFGAVYFYLDAARAGVAMAAREGAREYGVRLGRFDADYALAMGRGKAWDVLVKEGLLKNGSGFLPPGQPPPKGEKGASVRFSDSGEWVSCEITYYLPCPLPGLPRLLGLAPSQSWGSWYRGKDGHFVFKVGASAKKEYQN